MDFLTLELLQMDVRLDAHASDRTKLKMTPLEVLHERLEVVAPSFVLVQAVGIGDCVYFAGYNKPDDEEAARMIQLEQALPTLVLFCWRPLSSAPELDLNEVLIEEPPQIAIGGTFVGAETHVVQVFGKVPDGHGEFKPHGGWAVNVESGATVFTNLDECGAPFFLRRSSLSGRACGCKWSLESAAAVGVIVRRLASQQGGRWRTC